jgi:hypothetical protein
LSREEHEDGEGQKSMQNQQSKLLLLTLEFGWCDSSGMKELFTLSDGREDGSKIGQGRSRFETALGKHERDHLKEGINF